MFKTPCLCLCCLGLCLGWGCSERAPSALTPSRTSATISSEAPPKLHPVPLPHSLAILPFEDYTNQPELSWLQQGLPDMLITDLGLLPGLRLVSRRRLGEVLREQWLQQQGTFQEKSTVRIGQLVGARYLLEGQYYLQEENLVVEGHVLDVEQGVVIRTVREQGPYHSPPEVEMRFARRLGRLFTTTGSTPFLRENSTASLLEKNETTRVLIHPERENEKLLAAPSMSTGPVIQERDILVMLDRFRVMRETARVLAEEVWATGMQLTIGGSSDYGGSEIDHGNPQRSLFLQVPVSVSLLPQQWQRLRPLLTRVTRRRLDGRPSVFLRFTGEDFSAQEIFRETLRRPRRLFVRMMNHRGVVVAVSSMWSWRMDHLISLQSDGAAAFPMASNPILSGHAIFPGRWIAEHGSDVRFDGVIVTVSREKRSVVVEKISTDTASHPTPDDESSLERALREWVFREWNPPVLESVPVSGYLPGNRRIAIVRISIVGSRVQQITVTKMPLEAGFAESILTLLARLKGLCLEACYGEGEVEEMAGDTVALRVQFELIKDIQQVGLNQKG